MTLIHLPTLDGTPEAAVARLEAWLLQTFRRDTAHHIRLNGSRHATIGDRQDQLDLVLEVAS